MRPALKTSDFGSVGAGAASRPKERNLLSLKVKTKKKKTKKKAIETRQSGNVLDAARSVL
jgi:hypothetical protein